MGKSASQFTGQAQSVGRRREAATEHGHIELLGGSIPSPLGGCSNGSNHKRRAGLFAIVQDVEAIVEDLSAEIRQLINQPPSPEVVKLIEEQLDALKQVSEEQGNGHPSTKNSASSVPQSTI
ncbi:MAG: hypothetical protein Q9208_007252 [Pyrenodesmia sp. 3 TL-2023]